MPTESPSNVPLDKPVSHFLSTNAITLDADLTIDSALAHLRSSATIADSQIVYFYVLDSSQKLVGVLPTRRLLLSPANSKLRDLVLPTLITLNENDTLFDALELFAIHHLLAIPVVSATGQFKGILDVSLYTEEVFDLAEKRQLSGVFQRIGLHLENIRQGSPLAATKVRLPWLLCNVAGGLTCAALGSFFDAVVAKYVVLALFIPLILTLAESISVQSMTLAIESAASKRSAKAALLREALTAALLGFSCGTIVALIATLWSPGLPIVLLLGSAIATTMLLAALLGATIPKLIYLLKLNPRIASGPVTLACVDILTVTCYLSSATMVLH